MTCIPNKKEVENVGAFPAENRFNE